MADSLRAVRAQSISGSGNQDFVVSGFGTPTAAIILSHISAAASYADDYGVCHGFSDGTNQVCNGGYANDADVQTTSKFATNRDTHVVRMNDETSTRTATCTLITDGVRLNWDQAAGLQPWVTVILISAVAAQVGWVKADGTAPNTVNETTTGVDPNCVFIATAYNSSINQDGGNMHDEFGFAIDEAGGAKHFSITKTQWNLVNGPGMVWVSDVYSSVSGSAGGADLVSAHTISAFGTGQFTVRTDDPYTGGQILPYLAVEFETVPRGFIGTTPTSGDWDPYTDTVKPQSVFMIATGAETKNATLNASDSQTSGKGIYFVSNEGDELGFYEVTEHGVANVNSAGRHDPNYLVLNESHTTVLFDANSPTFDDSGLLYAAANINHDTSALYYIGIAFGEAAAAVTPKYYRQNLGYVG